MMVGVAGSGKSTIANELMGDRDDIIYVSSDTIRIELFGEDRQDKNAEVFNEVLKRVKDGLKDGKHVIMDATNVNRKRRRGFIQQLPKDVKRIACYVSTEYDTIIEQNNSRDRIVPQDAIDNMYKNMHIPIYSEGWDDIVFFHHDYITDSQLPPQFSNAIRVGALFNREGYDIMGFLSSYFNEFSKIYDLPQDSKYHSFSVSRHTYYVYKHIIENYQPIDDEDMEVMIWTSLLHDIGKPFCKSFVNRKGEQTKYANFICHENVGSQIAVQFLHKMNFSDNFIHKVATLIQFHMYLLNKDANREKLKRYVGEDTYNKLLVLRDADTLAH